MCDVTYSPDGKLIAACGFDGWVVIWNSDNWEIRRKIQLGDFGFDIRQVSFTPDSRYLLTANANSTVYILRLTDERTSGN